MKPPSPTLLCIAGFDPTGGAGLQADVETAAALGVRAVCAQTCNTVQDGAGTRMVAAAAPETLARQIACLSGDFDVAAVKTGLITSADNVETVAREAAKINAPLVADPVLRDGTGVALCDEDAAPALRARLLPLAACATPNAGELAALVPEAAASADAARTLLDEGCAAVLVTGEEQSEHTLHHALYSFEGSPGRSPRRSPRRSLRRQAFSSPRLPGEFHGSGCTLSCALAAQLALGKPLHEAVARALAFTARALERAESPSRSRARKFPKRL